MIPNPITPDTDPTVRLYKEEPVRYVMDDGVPYFEASTICTLMKLPLDTIGKLDAIALDTDIAQHAFDDLPTAVLSPIGVFKLSQSTQDPAGLKVACWARREAAALVANPSPLDARLFLTLNADGSRPDYPGRFSGRVEEWKELVFLPGYKSPRQISVAQYFATARQQRADAAQTPPPPSN